MRGRKRKIPPIGYILLGAFIIHLIFWLQLKNTLFFENLSGQVMYYDYWGMEVAKGDWMAGTNLYVAAPLLIYYFGIIYKLFGMNMAVIRFLSFVFCLLSIPLVYWSAKKLFNEFCGIVAGILFALFGNLLYYEAIFPGQAFLMFLVLLSFYIYLRIFEDRLYRLLPILGVLLAMVSLIRPNLAVYIPLCLLALWLQTNRLPIKYLVYFAMAIILVISPFIWRNYALTGEIGLTSNMGIAFYSGNNPDHPKGYGPIDFVRGTVKDIDFGAYKAEAERIAGRFMTAQEVSNFWMKRALQLPLTRPWTFIQVTLKKIGHFWHPYDIPADYSYLVFQRIVPGLRYFLSFYLLIPLGIASMIMTFKNPKVRILVNLIFVYMGATVFFVVIGRYRMLIGPFLIILIANLVQVILNMLKKAEYRSLLYAGLIILLLLLGTGALPWNQSPAAAATYMSIANIYEQQRNYLAAETWYRKAYFEHPSSQLTLIHLARICAVQDKVDEAVSWYKEALKNGSLTSQELQMLRQYEAQQGMGGDLY